MSVSLFYGHAHPRTSRPNLLCLLCSFVCLHAVCLDATSPFCLCVPAHSFSHPSFPVCRPSRHPSSSDEPFAWPAREFLRKLAIGKRVKFQVEYRRTQTSGTHRDFGAVYIEDAAAAGGFGENLCKTVVRAGWAKVVPEAASKAGKSKDHATLLELEDAAKTAAVGINQPQSADAGIRDVSGCVTCVVRLAARPRFPSLVPAFR